MTQKTKTRRNDDKAMEEAFRGFPTYETWKKVGFYRRLGALVPLSSLRSRRNQGAGDFADIPAFRDLLKEIGGSIIQLLPINDMGRGKTPYSSISAFALDPLYVALDEIPEMNDNRSGAVSDYLARHWPGVKARKGEARLDVDGVRAFKFGALYHLFRDFVDRNRPWNTPRWREFTSYLANNRYWLDDYALFRCLKNSFNWARWEEWPAPYRFRHREAIDRFTQDNYDELMFFKYIQWAAYTQMAGAHNACREDDVLVKGDIPLLVDYESADVWAHPEYFNLSCCAGAPPDQYSQMGQNWGSPTYNWDRLCQDNYLWWRKRLEYASHFYDIFRVDHVVGLFRIWTYPESPEFPRGRPAGWNGYFDPEDLGRGQDKPVWENHGKSLLKMMVESCEMLPIGEDLGTIPAACRYVMRNMGIPGYKVILWERAWGEKGSPFYGPEEYSLMSMATTTTHDFWTLPGYWLHREDGSGHQEDLQELWKFVMGKKKFQREYGSEFHLALLKRVFDSGSVFAILPFVDLWGCVPGLYGDDVHADRINDPSNPGREENWTGRMPIDIEDFASHPGLKPLVASIGEMARKSGRA